MRRKGDPVPPGAEIYWDDRADAWGLLWLLFPFLVMVIVVLLMNPPKSVGEWLFLPAFAAVCALAFYLLHRASPCYTLLDGDRVEIGYPSGKTVSFSMDEITGYRFGKLVGAEKVFGSRYRYSNANIRIYFGSDRSFPLSGIPGYKTVMTRLRTLGLEPQWFPPEERPDSFAIRRSMRVEGDRLICHGDEIPLSEIRVKQPITSTVLTRINGDRIVKLSDESMNNLDLLAWKLERNGVSVGNYLPKL